jgi:hypothetical protein
MFHFCHLYASLVNVHPSFYLFIVNHATCFSLTGHYEVVCLRKLLFCSYCNCLRLFFCLYHAIAMLMIGLWLCWFIDILWFGVCGSLKCFYFSLVQQYPAWLSVIPVIHDTIVPVFMVESSIRRDTRKCILWFLLNTHNCESQQSHVYQSCHKWQNADSICD